MTPHPVRDHVRQVQVRPETEEQGVLVMPAHLSGECYRCSALILPGEPYFIVTMYRGEPYTLVHLRCEDEARR